MEIDSLCVEGFNFNLRGYADIEFLEAAGEDIDVGLLDHRLIVTSSKRQQQRRNAGSLHCATDDETVRCFGRDDAVFWETVKDGRPNLMS